MKRSSKGFSLIELLIVVAIILIIAAIAIPDLLKSRQAANQASAVASLRTLDTSNVTYSSTYTTGFAGGLSVLGPPAAGGVDNATNSDLIDSILASAIKSNYQFEYVANPAVLLTACVNNPATYAATGNTTIAAGTNVSSYNINASPFACVVGNGNYYFTDQSSVIRLNNISPAQKLDSPLAG
jgi:type IV pilus assembly protein PilA